jgi:hypothetical protein
MLERVAQGQTRFNTPGISVDTRGVALGRMAVLLFPSLDGLVGWLRLYSAEAGLEDLLAELAILRVRTALRARAFLLSIPAQSSYALDRAARCARLWGGTTYTGTSRHFVKYRDEKSPYGYDVLGTVGGDGDFVLHGEEGAQAYLRDGELDVRTLIFRLSLQRVPGSERLDPEGRAALLVTVPPGLSRGVVRYLWKNRVEAQAAQITLVGKGEFAAPGSPEGYLLLRVVDVPERILGSFHGTPGMTIYRPLADNVAVEIGYRHPIELSSCAALFAADQLALFSGSRDAVELVAGPIAERFADLRHLTEVTIAGESAKDRQAQLQPVDKVGVPLRLSPTLQPPRKVVGTLIDAREALRLKQLVYALPPALLRGHRMAVTERGILLVATGTVDIVPLGTLLAELAPGLMIPLGMDLVPRVAPDVLAAALGHDAGELTVFPYEGGPFQVAQSALQPLERHMLAALAPAEAGVTDLSRPAPRGEPTVVNDPVGAFALWGFPRPAPERKALPPGGQGGGDGER